MATTRPLCTIGYEHATPPRLHAALRLAEVSLVVDVRAIAGSRRPGFAKTALRAGLAEAGIGYLHLPALGTPAAGRAASREGRTSDMIRIFEARLETPESQAALADLASLAAQGRVALLCLEAEACRCHRARIADRLVAQGGFERIDLTP